jgi:hypothetical protein
VVPEENIFEKVMAIAHTGELKKTNRTMEKKNCLSWPLNHPEGIFVLQPHIN